MRVRVGRIVIRSQKHAAATGRPQRRQSKRGSGTVSPRVLKLLLLKRIAASTQDDCYAE